MDTQQQVQPGQLVQPNGQPIVATQSAPPVLLSAEQFAQLKQEFDGQRKVLDKYTNTLDQLQTRLNPNPPLWSEGNKAKIVGIVLVSVAVGVGGTLAVQHFMGGDDKPAPKMK